MPSEIPAQATRFPPFAERARRRGARATGAAAHACKVSVAVCVHQGERYLREQLDSLLAQTGIDLEIVILDDASSDTSAALLQEYAVRDARVRYFLNTRNLGPLRSFERAMSLTRGDFIAACDQDDIWQPHKLERLLDAIGDADLAYCDSALIDGEGRATGQRLSDVKHMLAGRDPLPFLFANSVSGHAALVRRQLFEAARAFPPGVYHDWWLALCAADRNGVVYVDEPLVSFRRHERAFSTIGRGDCERKLPTRNRQWVEQHVALASAHARLGVHGRESAAALLAALRRATQHGHLLPLARQLWRLRAAAPPAGRGPAWANWVRQVLRFRRKLRRMRREPAQASVAMP